MDSFGVRLNDTVHVLRQVASAAPGEPLALVFLDLSRSGALLEPAAAVELVAEGSPTAGFVYGPVPKDCALPWSVVARPSLESFQRDATVLACALAVPPGPGAPLLQARVAALQAMPTPVAEAFGPAVTVAVWDPAAMLRTLYSWWSDDEPKGVVFRIQVPARLVAEFMDVLGIMADGDGAGEARARVSGKDTVVWFPDGGDDVPASRRSVEAVVEELGGEASNVHLVLPIAFRNSRDELAAATAAQHRMPPPPKAKAAAAAKAKPAKARRQSEERRLNNNRPFRRTEPCFGFKKGTCPLTDIACLRAHGSAFEVCSKCHRRGHVASACQFRFAPEKAADRACPFGIYCTNGKWCKKNHHPDEDELFRSLGDGHGFPLWKSRLCVTRHDGHVPDKCRFAHGLYELRCSTCHSWGHPTTDCPN